MINQQVPNLKIQIDELYDINLFKFPDIEDLKFYKIPKPDKGYTNIVDVLKKRLLTRNDNEFIDFVFRSLVKEEKDFLSFCFTYIKNQLIYYLWFQGTDNPEFKNNNSLFDFNNSDNFDFYSRGEKDKGKVKKEDIEILILLLPHIKDFEGLKNIKNLKEIFLTNDDGDFKYSNMFYNLNDQSVSRFTLEYFENFKNIKEFFVNNIIILLQTLEKTFCRLFVNWINVFPFDYPKDFTVVKNGYSDKLPNFQNSRIFINTYQLFENKKNFIIDYKKIKFDLLSENNKVKNNILSDCFFNGVFPISSIYDSLQYFNEITSFKSLKNKFWYLLKQEKQNDFIENLDINGLSRIFNKLSLTGTLSFCYSSKKLLEDLKRSKEEIIEIDDNQEIKEGNPLDKSGILKKYNNKFIEVFGNCFYFLTNSSYIDNIKYYQSLLKIENFLLSPKDDKDNNLNLNITELKKSIDLEHNKTKIKTNLNNEKLTFNVFNKIKLYEKWINLVSEEKLLYSAQFMSQINVYNKFINNRVMFITGGTGTGKSTQFPILLLYGLKAFDYKKNGTIIDTQPRKNATENNAGAVASFTGLFIPKLHYSPYVQYLTGDTDLHFKKEDKPDNLKITFVTDKILLDEINKTFLLLNNDSTNKYDIVVVDEVHEHNKNMDLILTLMRNVVYLNNSMRLVLVSATIEGDEPRYRQYYRYIEDILKHPFNNSYSDLGLQLSYLDRRVNISNPSLTTYNINDYFINDKHSQQLGLYNPYSRYNFKNLGKNDYSVIEEINNKNTLKIINHVISTDPNNKHILIFKAGTEEILNCIDFLINSGINEKLYFVPWVNSVTEETKRLISEIEKNPKTAISKIHKDRKKYNDDTNYEKPEGFSYNRFVLVATNVVEASITINDLGYVIDDGFQKSQFYDYSTNESKLKKNIISDQSRIQRRGRVGRVADGDVYYLYQYKDIKDSRVKYKICYENFIPEYFSLIEQQESQKIKTNFDNNQPNPDNEFIDLLDFSQLQDGGKEQEQIEKIKNMYYGFEFRYKNKPKYSLWYYENCNQNLTPFYYGDTLYSNFGYDTKTINDTDAKFYLIHPNELNIKRNKVNGQIIKTDTSFNYLLYCEKYYILPLIGFYEGSVKKSSFYSVYDKIYFSIFSFLGYDSLNNLLTIFVYFFILSYFNERQDKRRYFKDSVQLFYIFCCYSKLKNVIDFDILNKNLNMFSYRFDDFNFMIAILMNQYYRNLKEHKKIEELKKEDIYKLDSVYNFIVKCIKNHKEELKPYFNYDDDNNEKVLPNIKELLNLDFDNLVFLCFYDNIVLPYRNTKSTYISKKIKDQNVIDNMKEQNLFYFINLFKPITKEIKLDFHNSCLKFTGNSDFYDSNINNIAYVYFDNSENDSTRFIKCLYKFNDFNDIKVLGYIFRKINEFCQINPKHLQYLYNIDYLIENCHETGNMERVKKYNDVYKIIGNKLLNKKN